MIYATMTDPKLDFLHFDPCVTHQNSVRSTDIHDILLHLIAAVHDCTGAHVRVGQRLKLISDIRCQIGMYSCAYSFLHCH